MKDPKKKQNFNGNKGSNKRRSGKRDSKPPINKTDSASEAMPTTNEFSWYNSNPALVEASARVPFPYRPGMDYPAFARIANVSAGETSLRQGFSKIPGLMMIEWAPSFGKSNDVTSPISMAARDIFSRVRSAFSGSISVDAPDFLIHIMAMDSIYAYIAWLCRVYKALNTFTPDNLLTPECILSGMRFSDKQINVLKANRVELYGRINELISMVHRFNVPDIFPVLTRHRWMSERFYCDAKSSMSQIYCFNPVALYKFQVDSAGAGQLVSTKLDPHDFGVTTLIGELFTFGTDLIAALSNWDDCYIINGYLARAYESTKMINIPEIGLNDIAELVYDEVVLTQIENATCPPVEVEGVDASLSQVVASNALVAEYKLHAAASAPRSVMAGWAGARINLPDDQPTAADTVEASRLLAIFDVDKQDESLIKVSTCGTEIPVNFVVIFYDGVQAKYTRINCNDLFLHSSSSSASDPNVTVDVTALNRYIDAIGVLSSFDWHPLTLGGVITTNGSSPATASYYMIGDVRNLTHVSLEDLDNINRVCLYSQFNSFSK